MKYIIINPAISRFKWENEILVHNLTITHNVNPNDVILIYGKYDDAIPEYFQSKYHVQTFTYSDDRKSKTYIPSVQPYLWYKFLLNNPHMENETYFYIDSDVLFREIPDFSKINFDKHHWFGSDCDSYLSPNYINSKGDHLLKDICNKFNLDFDWVSSLNGKSEGAQKIICKPKKEYFLDVYDMSNELYKYLCNIESAYRKEHKKNDPHYEPIQKWCSSMWAELWCMHKYNISPSISHELDFSWATSGISDWDKNKIYHNAGVMGEDQKLFFKGKYIGDLTPFDDDLSFVDKTKCSYRYVQAIEKVKNNK